MTIKSFFLKKRMNTFNAIDSSVSIIMNIMNSILTKNYKVEGNFRM